MVGSHRDVTQDSQGRGRQVGRIRFFPKNMIGELNAENGGWLPGGVRSAGAMKTVVLTVTCFLAINRAVGGAAEQAVFQTVSAFNGTNYRSIVLERELAGQPTWKATDDFPPLSPRRAESAGRAKLAEMFPAIDGWKSEKISLLRVGDPGNWIYVVQMQPLSQVEPSGGHLESIDLVVLMNGKTIAPTGEKVTRRVLRLE